MKRTALPGIALGLLLFGCSGVLFAAVGGELRERARLHRKEASVMAERGKKELVWLLERESVWLVEAAERHGDRPDIVEASELRERAKALRSEASVMLERGQKELGGLMERESVWLVDAAERLELTETLEIASRRIHHLRVAAENLKKAEVPDLAHQVMEKAEALEREVKELRQKTNKKR